MHIRMGPTNPICDTLLGALRQSTSRSSIVTVGGIDLSMRPLTPSPRHPHDTRALGQHSSGPPTEILDFTPGSGTETEHLLVDMVSRAVNQDIMPRLLASIFQHAV